jgi:uroporphyrinogen decarboxylase
MNKREMMLRLIDGEQPDGYTPPPSSSTLAPEYHEGQAAIDRHLQFFRHTGMDFVKIQYEQGMAEFAINSPPTGRMRGG